MYHYLVPITRVCTTMQDQLFYAAVRREKCKSAHLRHVSIATWHLPSIIGCCSDSCCDVDFRFQRLLWPEKIHMHAPEVFILGYGIVIAAADRDCVFMQKLETRHVRRAKATLLTATIEFIFGRMSSNAITLYAFQ